MRDSKSGIQDSDTVPELNACTDNTPDQTNTRRRVTNAPDWSGRPRPRDSDDNRQHPRPEAEVLRRLITALRR